MKNYVIIGNSAAAIGAVQGIRSVDRDGSITIITDEAYHTYSRPLISYWLEGKVADDKIYYREPDFYEKNNVKTIFSTRAEKIENGCVVLDNGEKVQYDKLLVATGSNPFVPAMKGLDEVEDKLTFMTWDSAKAIREKHIYKEYIGLDACAANLMRPAIYGAYHHITVMGKENQPCDHKYDITGGLCENCDKFAVDRMLPKIDIGDIIYIHDTGAHGFSMGYNYNGKLRSAEVLLKEGGSFKLIRRAETPEDYFATFDFSDKYSFSK